MTEPTTPSRVARTNASWAFVLSLVGVPFVLTASLGSGLAVIFGILLGGIALAVGVDSLVRLRHTKPPNSLAIIAIVLGAIEVVIAIASAVSPSQI